MKLVSEPGKPVTPDPGGPALTGTVTITASSQPSLSGEYIMGQTLTAAVSNSNGMGVESFVWKANNVVIPNVTSSAYTIADSDRNKTITVQAWHSENSGSITSAPVKIHPGKPVSTPFDLIAIGIDLAENYILTSDITVTTSPVTTPITGNFAGIFDGNGKTITFDNVSDGLFAVNYGTIKNLKLTGTINAGDIAVLGAVAGFNNNGTIQNISSSVVITRNDTSLINAGGIVGTNYGPIKNCYSTGNITVSASGGFSFAGGIAGDNSNEILYCWANGNINNTDGYPNRGAGGIVGQSYTNISNCIALNGSVIAGAAYYGIQVGRIWGDGLPTAANNYGLDTMTNGSSTPWTNNTPNGQDGGDVSSAQAASQTWWTGTAGWTINPADGGGEASPWVWGGNRPKLWFE
jgi:hypothetical protein